MTDNLKQTIDEQLNDITFPELKRAYKSLHYDWKYLRMGAKILAFTCVFLIATIWGILYASINLSFGFQWGAL